MTRGDLQKMEANMEETMAIIKSEIEWCIRFNKDKAEKDLAFSGYKLLTAYTNVKNVLLKNKLV